ncbi:MAG: Gfo/Idh/MocA family oxidoreductase [Ilumatobacter sp.]|nr:Gfo/Idh/MocA family oxidoreductase [Ilumatobacter sp.]
MAHRVGIIGLGTVGARFVEQFNLHRDYELVAAWDPDDAACAAHSAAVEIRADAAAVIEAADAVYIAVPPLFHCEYVEACIAADTAIFCEKPLGIDVAESERLVASVEASGLPAGVNFVFSAAPSATGLGRAIEAGEIGDVVRADLRLHFAQWPRAWHARAEWLTRRDQGGWIREVASHFLFVAARVLGPLVLDAAVVTFADGPDGELCEADAFARFSAGGTPVSMTGTSGGGGPDVVDLTVRGATGCLRIWDWYRLQSFDGEGWGDRLGDDRVALGAAAYAAQLDELSAMLAGEPHRIATFAEALAVQRLVEQTLAAAP